LIKKAVYAPESRDLTVSRCGGLDSELQRPLAPPEGVEPTRLFSTINTSILIKKAVYAPESRDLTVSRCGGLDSELQRPLAPPEGIEPTRLFSTNAKVNDHNGR
jgi:hypothetical protein